MHVPQGGAAALRQLQQEEVLQPAQLPCGKSVYIYSGDGDDIEIYLDERNNIYSAWGYGAFDDLGAAPHRPASRSPPPPVDPIGAGRRIAIICGSALGHAALGAGRISVWRSSPAGAAPPGKAGPNQVGPSCPWILAIGFALRRAFRPPRAEANVEKGSRSALGAGYHASDFHH